VKPEAAQAQEDGHVHPRHWYTTNLVGVPTPVLASADFQRHPVPLHIAGTREAHPGLFALLERSPDLNEAGEMFMHYMELAFGLVGPGARGDPSEKRRWQASYLKLLQGWGLDANSQAGAVLKGWVESRFGIVPTFHHDPLRRYPSPVWTRYLEEKASSRFHNNCIYQQLDLIYEFCQWALVRFATLGKGPHVALWRGTNRCEEQVVDGRLRPLTPTRNRHITLRLNNVVSFSLDRDTADCFGDWIFAAHVPLCKVLFFPGLLPQRTLSGEGEVLVIGGDHDVEASYG
jgi:NAD+---dinitrogen-reductase ADP-D-ribosyltransferase